MRRVEYKDKDNLTLFDYNSYQWKSFGPFVVKRAEGKTHLDPEKRFSLGYKSAKVTTNSHIYMHSYFWKQKILDTEKIKFEIITRVDEISIVMHMLLHLNEDFDDDLLMDAMECIFG
jgi:hypothetical protein